MRGRMPAFLVALTAACALLSACGRASLAPEDVPLDHVVCARCGMVVSDPATAAEVVARNAETRFYDDPGCLAADVAPAAGEAEAWVRVDGGKAWKRGSEAFFARPRGARTPMGYGFLAFSSQSAARSVDRDGRAWTWSETRSEIARADPKTPGGQS